MKMEETDCSETSEYKFQTPGNYPEESIQQGKQCKPCKISQVMWRMYYNRPELVWTFWKRKKFMLAWIQTPNPHTAV